MRHALLLLATLTACGGSPKPTPTAPPPPDDAASSSAPAADGELVVDDRGVEPRYELRYRAPVGTRAEMGMTLSMETLVDGVPAHPRQEMQLNGSFEVIEVSADGGRTIRATFVDFGDPVDLRYDAFGHLLDDVPGGGESGGTQELPRVPVGRGARWAKRDRATPAADITLDRTTRFEVVDVDADHVRLRIEVEATGMQASTIPVTATGRGEFDIELATLRSDGSVDMTFTAIEGGREEVRRMTTKFAMK